MMKEETIHLINLATGYHDKKGTTVITNNINACLYNGELTCLLGPNGAGKSTLLKTLTAFLPPVRGEIIIEHKPLCEYSDSELSRVIGVVLTEKLAINNMSVDELVGMGRSPYTGFWGRMDDHDREVVDEAISLVGIEHLRGRMIQTLSDGERQKVMIAKALAQETPIIFLDEPTAFLDYPSKVEIMQLLQKLARDRNKTVFQSTHDLELALQIADKIWLLDKSHGLTVGSPEDLSLNGDMSVYFHREGVDFDMETGLFRIAHDMRHRITLEGSGSRANMVKKGLARHGITTISEHEPGLHFIKVERDNYYLDNKPYPSIDTLLEAVVNLVNKIDGTDTKLST